MLCVIGWMQLSRILKYRPVLLQHDSSCHGTHINLHILCTGSFCIVLGMVSCIIVLRTSFNLSFQLYELALVNAFDVSGQAKPSTHKEMIYWFCHVIFLLISGSELTHFYLRVPFFSPDLQALCSGSVL